VAVRVQAPAVVEVVYVLVEVPVASVFIWSGLKVPHAEVVVNDTGSLTAGGVPTVACLNTATTEDVLVPSAGAWVGVGVSVPV